MSTQTVGSQGEQQPLLYDLDTVARLLSISVWTVRAYVKNGKIKSLKISARRLVPASEVERIAAEGISN
jgi:excisionase family DNA binding protein